MLNPGAWTHYAWAIRDALELAGLPAVEVHLSDVDAREEWRRVSVISDLCLVTVAGKGVDGYREALERLKRELSPVTDRADRLAALLDKRGSTPCSSPTRSTSRWPHRLHGDQRPGRAGGPRNARSS